MGAAEEAWVQRRRSGCSGGGCPRRRTPLHPPRHPPRHPPPLYPSWCRVAGLQASRVRVQGAGCMVSGWRVARLNKESVNLATVSASRSCRHAPCSESGSTPCSGSTPTQPTHARLEPSTCRSCVSKSILPSPYHIVRPRCQSSGLIKASSLSPTRLTPGSTQTRGQRHARDALGQ